MTSDPAGATVSDEMIQKIRSRRAAKGVNQASVEEGVAQVEGITHRAPLQKSTLRHHAIEEVHFALFLEDLGLDSAYVLQRQSPRMITVSEWKAYCRARAMSTQSGVAGATGASIVTLKGRFHTIHAIVGREHTDSYLQAVP